MIFSCFILITYKYEESVQLNLARWQVYTILIL